MKKVDILDSTRTRLLAIEAEVKRLQTLSSSILQTVCEFGDINPALAEISPGYSSISEREPAPETGKNLEVVVDNSLAPAPDNSRPSNLQVPKDGSEGEGDGHAE